MALENVLRALYNSEINVQITWCWDAVCNFEAMYHCFKRDDENASCGFDRDQPESNGGCFGFMTKVIGG